MEKKLDREEVEKVIQNLKNGKAVRKDGIPAEVWKYMKGGNEEMGMEFMC